MKFSQDEAGSTSIVSTDNYCLAMSSTGSWWKDTNLKMLQHPLAFIHHFCLFCPYLLRVAIYCPRLFCLILASNCHECDRKQRCYFFCLKNIWNWESDLCISTIWSWMLLSVSLYGWSWELWEWGQQSGSWFYFTVDLYISHKPLNCTGNCTGLLPGL